MNLQQLGQLLWATLRIQEVHRASSGEAYSYERAIRPVACGGAMQEIDTYLLIQRCDGIESGVYRYDPQEHQLLRLGALTRLNSFSKCLCLVRC